MNVVFDISILGSDLHRQTLTERVIQPNETYTNLTPLSFGFANRPTTQIHMRLLLLHCRCVMWGNIDLSIKEVESLFGACISLV